jgi:hypothetical protein
MKWALRFAVTLFFCLVFFGAIEHYFEPNRWISIVGSVVAAVITATLATIDFGKKWHDFRKGPYELRKLKREEEAAEREKSSRIHLLTDDEFWTVMKPSMEKIERKNILLEKKKEHLITEDIVTDAGVREVPEVSRLSRFIRKLFR